MANPEQLQSLKQGPLAWNLWRHRNKIVTPDLSGANLSGAILASTSLLIVTDLREADLRAANLKETNLREADLRAANLTGALLVGTNLTGANLAGADLSHAMLSETVFSDTNLTAVEGLKTCDHIGPSTLDHRTLAKSGPLPLVFLRGCGLPEALIEYLPSLLGETIQFYSCFISYSLSLIHI